MKDQVLERLAAECGLTYVNEPEAATYGVFSGFGLVVKHLASEHQYMLVISAGPTQKQSIDSLMESMNRFASDRKKVINNVSCLDSGITISIREKGGDVVASIKEAIEASTYFCNQYGFVPVCKYCGSRSDLGFFAIGGDVDTMCTNCFNNRQMNMSNKAMEAANKQFNLPLGILGALLGAFLGGLIWVITYQMGFLLFITGAVIVFLSCILLEKMGGKLTSGGLVTALVISLAMVFIAEYLALGISFFTEFSSSGYSLGDSFSLVNMILFDSDAELIFGTSVINEAKAEVAKDLVYGVISYVVAAVLFVIQYVKKRKVEYKAVRLG